MNNTTTEIKSAKDFKLQDQSSNSTEVSNPNSYHLVLVDDNPMIRTMIGKLYQSNKDFCVKDYASGEDFFADHYQDPDIVILDFHLSDDDSKMNGLAILSKIKKDMPETKVIMLSSQGEVQTAVSCLKKGATDYVVKDDVMNVSVKKSVEQIIKSLELKLEIQNLSQTIKRDKLLIKGYMFVIFFLVILATFLFIR